jgi:hypothetical protein
VHRPTQRAFAKENDLRQTFLVRRSDPSFRASIDTSRLDDRTERNGVLRIMIMETIATVPKNTASIHRHISGYLLHPLLIRMDSEAGNINLAALQMDKKQHVVGHQPRKVKTSTVKKSVPANTAR